MQFKSIATAKVAAVAAGLAMATSMLTLAPLAHAQTPAAPCSVGTVNLTVGSTGEAVKCLQTTLVAGGYLVMPTGVSTGTFGPLTKAAVMKWQTAMAVAPAAGYFGPISRAAFTGTAMTGGPSTVAGCTAGAAFSSTTGAACTTTTTVVPGCVAGALFSGTTGAACGTAVTPAGPLAGTDGSISDVTELGSLNGEDVAEGNKDIKVLGADVEASNDGDIALKSVKVSFDPAGNTGSDNLDDYLDSVSIWLGSTKVGSADAADFSQGNNDVYTKTITLSGNTTIKADQVAKLYVAVTAVGNIDSADIANDSWTVDIENIRFVDGSGVFTTDDSTGDIDGMDVPISFVTFATSAETDLEVSTASDSPQQGFIVVKDAANTDNQLLLKGKLKLDGTSNVVLDEFPVTFTTIGGASLVAVTGSVTLKIGDKTFTESVSSSATVATITFDNLNFAIKAGATVDFEVRADINDIDAGNLDEGDVLKADVTATNRDYMDVENSEGDQLADASEKSGTATGKYQEFRVSGIGLTLVSVKTSVAAGTAANDDQGTFTITYKVTAFGNSMYVSSLADAKLTGVTTGQTSVNVDRAGTATIGGTSVALSNLTDTTKTSVGNYLIEEGSSETFELTVTVQLPTSGAAGLFKAALGGVSYSTTDIATPGSTYTSSLDAFKTSYIGLN